MHNSGVFRNFGEVHSAGFVLRGTGTARQGVFSRSCSMRSRSNRKLHSSSRRLFQITLQRPSVRAGASTGHISDLALVNVDYVSPSLWLGVVLAITGMVLYSLKIRNTKGTQEVDIVAASLFVTCGGVLILQGWRLDPMLMLSEGVLAAVSIFYMVQTVNLRKELEDQAGPSSYDYDAWRGIQQQQQQPFPDRQAGYSSEEDRWPYPRDVEDRRYLGRGQQQWSTYDEGLVFDADYRQQQPPAASNSNYSNSNLNSEPPDIYPDGSDEFRRPAQNPRDPRDGFDVYPPQGLEGGSFESPRYDAPPYEDPRSEGGYSDRAPPERRPYGVETSSPDSLVPTDDWNQPPPRK